MTPEERREIEEFAKWQKENPLAKEDHPPLRDSLKGVFGILHQLGDEVKSLADKLDQMAFQSGMTGEIPGGPLPISPMSPPRSPWRRREDGRLELRKEVK